MFFSFFFCETLCFSAITVKGMVFFNMMGTYCHLLASVGTVTMTGLAVWDMWLQIHNVAHSLEPFFCASVVWPVLHFYLYVFLYLFVCLFSWTAKKKREERSWEWDINKAHCPYMCFQKQGHSSIPWLQHPTPNKHSSLWAACYSQCEFPNGRNGGQDHLLLLGGEVCIRLQLRRKTSWCL